MSDSLRKKSDSLICSFIMSDLSELLTFTHLLICHERPERLAHGSFFDMRNLSDLLIVAHLS